MGWTSGGDRGQHGFAEGVPDFGAVASWCRTSGSETPSESSLVHFWNGTWNSHLIGNARKRVGEFISGCHPY
eukprot:8169626-Alexandrium_andersonii.AAC.1